MNIEQLIGAYTEALYFTDTGDEGQPPAEAELAPSTVQAIAATCKTFRETVADWGVPDHLTEQVGHDFWLTRNGHGTGFWDRTELYGKELATRLDTLATSLGACDVYEGDDGLIYILGSE